jgi:hypothetical protein
MEDGGEEMTDLPEHIKAAAASSPEKSDRLAAARALAATARDLEREISDLEERTAEAKSRLNVVIKETLPDLMDQAGITKLELKPEGNEPGYGFSLGPYYSAGIAAKWPFEKKREAFKYLEEAGAGDLIKTFITSSFSREKRDEAMEFAAELRRRGIEAEVESTVHASTLKAWLKETVEAGGDMPQLDKIGGFVGRQVTIKKLKG